MKGLALPNATVDGLIEIVAAAGPEQQKLRDPARDSMFLHATLRPIGDKDAASFIVRVRNLSAGGMMAETNVELSIDDPMSVALRNVGTVKGRVAWVRAGRFGVTFDTPIDPKLARKPGKQDHLDPVITGTGYHRVTHPLG